MSGGNTAASWSSVSRLVRTHYNGCQSETLGDTGVGQGCVLYVIDYLCIRSLLWHPLARDTMRDAPLVVVLVNFLNVFLWYDKKEDATVMRISVSRRRKLHKLGQCPSEGTDT